ncbi:MULTISPECIES: hypothetical protein [Bacteroidota]|uniref:Uncharacterized protein n=1 Tax=Zunongwangia pacifica TaxID=2911062 RepID=A0A9X1ZRK5_9FLAO|nr:MULTISPECIES: hypothetical protein [Bacteroidota]MCC4227105.1 hypothetical protein [Zunongwangia profunda]MCL6218634.1 hypothetical protein [Zunongwangia pacifica]
MEFRWGGLRSRFRMGMQCSFPEHREGSTEWKGEIVDGVQDFLGKLFCRNVAFRGMEGQCAERYFK